MKTRKDDWREVIKEPVDPGRNSRSRRPEVLLRPDVFLQFPASKSAWHESNNDKAQRLIRSRETRRLMRWVQVQMKRHLTKREKMCIEMYYLQEMTMRQIGEVTQTHASSVLRAIQRGLRRLRSAAREDYPELKNDR